MSYCTVSYIYYNIFCFFFFFKGYGDHQDLHNKAHSFPTRRSSDLANKDTAMKILRSRLAEKAEEEREAELAKEPGEIRSTGFGSQIRSYVLHPYQLVKDLRTEHEVGNAQGVLDGDLDGFVHAYLLAKAAGKAL